MSAGMSSDQVIKYEIKDKIQKFHNIDVHKAQDKEWTLLRNEENVYYKTRDDIENLPINIIKDLESIKDEPLKNGTVAKDIYNRCMDYIVNGIKDGSLIVR